MCQPERRPNAGGSTAGQRTAGARADGWASAPTSPSHTGRPLHPAHSASPWPAVRHRTSPKRTRSGDLMPSEHTRSAHRERHRAPSCVHPRLHTSCRKPPRAKPPASRLPAPSLPPPRANRVRLSVGLLTATRLKQGPDAAKRAPAIRRALARTAASWPSLGAPRAQAAACDAQEGGGRVHAHSWRRGARVRQRRVPQGAGAAAAAVLKVQGRGLLLQGVPGAAAPTRPPNAGSAMHARPAAVRTDPPPPCPSAAARPPRGRPGTSASAARRGRARRRRSCGAPRVVSP